MPHYMIELIPLSGEGTPEREERRFANLGNALERAREVYRWRNASVKGFRIFNAAGELLHVWVPLSSPAPRKRGEGSEQQVARKADATQPC